MIKIKYVILAAMMMILLSKQGGYSDVYKLDINGRTDDTKGGYSDI